MTAHGRRLAAIAIAAFALRLVLLAARGDYLVYDEGYYLLLAKSLRGGHGFALGGLPQVALSPLQPLLVAGLSLAGLPDLWASRLLAAGCGAGLVLPVAFLARRWFDARVALAAAAFLAAAPALLAFLPFFPGERWNLYFGSEPLYLLLAAGALAAAVRAVDGGEWRWWLAAGALAALSYLTRLEGAILGAAIGVVVTVTLARRRAAQLVPRAAAAFLLAGLLTAPYLLYLRATLGRWAVSGRVQAAVADQPTGPASPGRGGSGAVRRFVWGGDRQALWSTLYALDAGGARMASQYWGVAPRDSSARARPSPSAGSRGASAEQPERAGAARDAAGTERGGIGLVLRALLVVLPWWLLVLAAAGGLWGGTPREALLWSAPVVVAAVAPALLAYPEPRALLLLVPLACLFAARAAVKVGDTVARNPAYARGPTVAPLAVAVLLLVPTARDLARAWHQDLPLQRVSAARRAVGEYLGDRLPESAVIVSWHPAVAIYARREWRVLPYDSFERILGYARFQGASALVFSTFEPSPLRDPPRAFTAVLLDTAGTAAGGGVRLEPVDETPLLFVGRLARGTQP